MQYTGIPSTYPTWLDVFFNIVPENESVESSYNKQWDEEANRNQIHRQPLIVHYLGKKRIARMGQNTLKLRNLYYFLAITTFFELYNAVSAAFQCY